MSLNVSTTFCKLKMNEYIFGAAVFELIEVEFMYLFLQNTYLPSTFMGHICKYTKKLEIIATHSFTNFTLYTDFSVLICRGKKKTRLKLSYTQDTTVFVRSIENRYQVYRSVNTGKWYSILLRKLDWILLEIRRSTI